MQPSLCGRSERAIIRAEKAALSKSTSVPLRAEGGVVVEAASLQMSPSTAPPFQGATDEPAPSNEPKTTSSEKEPLQTAAPVPKASDLQPPQTVRSNKPAWKTAWMIRDTIGPPITTIESKSLLPDPTAVSSKDGFSTLCSYNWQTNGAIFVPGRPPKWSPPPLPAILPADTGRHFLDQNAYHVPKYPFEPAFQALSIMNPTVSLDAVDIIANRNSLRKLLDFSAGKKLDTFAMGLNMIKETLVLSRKEVNARYMVHGASNSGYGHNFEKAFTTAQDEMEESSSHHRVIKYHIGPLECVVRFEVDAYFDDPEVECITEEPELVNSITAAMAQLDVAGSQPPPETKHSTKVVQKGVSVSASKLAEIKAKRAGRFTDALPQLWFGRTPYFMNGNHIKGKVHSVTIVHAESEFAQWEELHQARLRKMVSLLVALKTAVKETQAGAAVLVYDEKGGPLKVYRVKRDGGVLPKETIAKYWSIGGSVGQ